MALLDLVGALLVAPRTVLLWTAQLTLRATRDAKMATIILKKKHRNPPHLFHQFLQEPPARPSRPLTPPIQMPGETWRAACAGKIGAWLEQHATITAAILTMTLVVSGVSGRTKAAVVMESTGAIAHLIPPLAPMVPLTPALIRETLTALTQETLTLIPPMAPVTPALIQETLTPIPPMTPLTPARIQETLTPIPLLLRPITMSASTMMTIGVMRQYIA